MRFCSFSILLLALSGSLPAADSVAVPLPSFSGGISALPSECLSFSTRSVQQRVDEYFRVARTNSEDCKTTVLEAPVQQEDAVKLYIAIDGDSLPVDG